LFIIHIGASLPGFGSFYFIKKAAPGGAVEISIKKKY